MDLLQRNPFTTIKANDLNDSEINEQWVDNPQGGFIDVFCPTHKISQYIIGGKGSGKTHLMRYFSYNSQSIRNANSVLDGIARDGYFGIYFQASGLNGDRFENLPFEIDKKNNLFEYAYELWCAGLVIQSIIDINKSSSMFLDEKKFCRDVVSLFSSSAESFEAIDNVIGLRDVISKFSKEVDYAVSNAFFVSDISVNIHASRGSLIFGIPKLISEHSIYFRDVTFLYIIDELENISESQQIYINTLLREKKLPCTFRIGARGYGIKTLKTLGSGEENREGHEFENVKLDVLLSEINEYEDFAINLILNRLKKSGFLSDETYDLNSQLKSRESRKKFLNSYFESPDHSYITDLNSTDKSTTKIAGFKRKLESSKIISSESIDRIVGNLSVSGSVLAECAMIHIFCQYWSSNKVTENQLVEYSDQLRYFSNAYSDNPSDTTLEISKKLSYYKNNYIAVLLRIKHQNNMEQYLGLENLFRATTGFPRHILTVLRNIYKTEVFEGRAPFAGTSKISLKSQKIAILEASNWFHNESGNEGDLGVQVKYFINNICELLRIEMYSDKPVECSASSFTVDQSKLSKDITDIIKWAELSGLIVKGTLRQDKNSQALIEKYHINSLLCPKWGLPLSRRGSLNFSASDFEIICKNKFKNEFESFKNKFDQSRNAPFKIEKETSQIGMDF